MPHVLIWAFLNYVGIVCESLSKAIWQTEFYQRIEVHKYIQNLSLLIINFVFQLYYFIFFRDQYCLQKVNVGSMH